MLGDVLLQVVFVGTLQQPQDGLARAPVPGPARGQDEADLKVQQIGLAVLAHENVFPFVQIDVGHVALVHLMQ